MNNQKLRVGSIFEIPLSGNRKAFGRYLYKDIQSGQIVQVFNYITDVSQEVNLHDLLKSGERFLPIFVGLTAAIREGYWKIIGFLPVESFSYPGFLNAHWGGDPPTIHQWFFWDENKYIALGPKLPNKYRNCEFHGVYSAIDVTRRIETCENSFIKTLLTWEKG